MAKVEYEDYEIENFKRTKEGQLYLEYNEKVGGSPLGLIVPIGYPGGFDKYGSVEAVYRECIRLGITWEDLLNYHPPKDAII